MHYPRRFTFESLETRRVLSAVSIPVDLTAEPAEQVVVPVEITDSTDVRGVEIEITYDTELLDADDDSVTVGSVWSSSSADIVASVDDAAGTIVAWISAAEGLGSASGSLVEIAFTVSDDAVVGSTTTIDLTEVVINEDEISVSPEPAVGTDSTDGLITFTEPEDDTDDQDTDSQDTTQEPNSLSGYVYIDRDGDGTRDDDECGVPGVQITLYSTDDSGSDGSLSVLTQADGSYSFNDLAPGTYQLVERQPTALADGQDSTDAPDAIVADDNIANIALESGECFAENNFGEAGLHVEYVSIRMFFASSPSPEECLLNTIVFAEEHAGYTEFEDAIRSGVVISDGENTAPVANSDAYSVTANEVLTIGADSGLLANDSDPEGDSLTVALATSPGNGSLTLNDDGSFVYTPDTDFVGTDSFTYRAYDGKLYSDVVTVTITVVEENAAPDATSDTYSTNEDSTLYISAASGVLANDSDADGDTLTVSLVSTSSNGSLSLDSDGSFTYEPDDDFSGTDSFTYRAFDGESYSAVTTATITVASVNDAPVAANDTYSATAGETLTVGAESGVLDNDSDVDDDGLTASVADSPSHGTLVLNSDGSFTYTPESGYSGTDSFTYVADDGTDTSAEATVTFTVDNVPEVADDSYEVDEDTVLAVDAVLGLLANDSDADGDTLTVSLVDSPDYGALTLNSDGSFTYTPEADFAGSDSFTYVATDGTNKSETATVAIAVAGIDDPSTLTLPEEFTDPDNVAERTVGEEIEFNVGVEDVDDDTFAFQLDLEASGIPDGAALPTIDSETGVFQWTPTVTGEFEIRVIVVTEDGEANQESFQIAIVSED